ncbi:MAG: sugar nucleotide-binding protein, partial [Verrucomicrobia bacterium]|nr:sugar nucleotide-binding protein [Verrucomicrobiota bacterium]
MSGRRILIIGKNGQVGFELRRSVASLGDVTATGSDELDLTREESIHAVLDRIKPDVIINAAGHTAVDKAEKDKENAEKLNAETPAVLARYSERNGALLVHYSTDYVFDGTQKRPYLE